MINYIVGEKGKRGPFVGFPVVSACHRPSLVAVALAGGREMACLLGSEHLYSHCGCTGGAGFGGFLGLL